MAVTPPEHRARTRRWGREEKRRRRRRRRTGEAAARDGRRERAAGLNDAEKVVLEPSPQPMKKPRRLPSQIGEVFGSLCRVESVDDIEDEVAVPDFAVAAPKPSPTPAAPVGGNPDEGVVLAPEAAEAPAQGSGAVVPSFPPPPAAASTSAVVTSLPVPPPPSSSPSSQVPAPRDKKPLLLFTASMPPPVAPPITMCPAKRKMTAAVTHQPPAAASASRATAPPPPLFPLQQPDDAFERRERLKKQFAGLITRSQKEIDDRYRENLRRGRVAPEPEAVVDQETLRRLAAIDAARKRFRRWMRRMEVKAKRDALFIQYARCEHLRTLGIDAAMERVVSPERPRDVDGKPIVSPEHPCSPVEKLGLFLKPL